MKVDQKEHGVWLQMGEPRWEQSPDPTQEDGFIFVARLNSYYLHGSMYIFYNPEKRQTYHLKQFT